MNGDEPMKTLLITLLIAGVLSACSPAAVAPTPSELPPPAPSPTEGPTTCVVLKETNAFSTEEEGSIVGTVRPGETFLWIRQARAVIFAGGGAMQAPVQVVQWRGVSPEQVYIAARMVDCSGGS